MKVPSMLKLNKVLPWSTRFSHSLSVILIPFLIMFFLQVPWAQEAERVTPTPLPGNIVPVPTGEALINVFVDGREYFDTSANLDNDAPFLKVSVLKEMFGPSLAPGPFTEIFGVVLSLLEWAGPEDLKAAGINTTWDMSKLSYTISIPSSMATLRELDFSPVYTAPGKQLFKPSFLSSAINLSSSSDIKFSSGTSFSQDLYIDGLIKIWDIALEGGGSFSWTPPQTSIALNKARAVYDIPAIGGRLLAGKVSADGISYQSEPEIWGLSLGSLYQFSRYDRRASPSVTFTLDKPSSVRIMINGLAVRAMKLDQGKYRIFDLPFASGLNTLEIHVTDDTGMEKILKPPEAYIAAEDGILVSGQSEYGFAAGVGYESPDQPFASANFRLGLDYKITMSAFAQGNIRSFLGGLTIMGGTDIGIISAAAASVIAWDGRAIPYSYAANFKYQISIPSKPDFPNISVMTEFVSEGFTPPLPSAVAVEANDAHFSVTGSVGGNIGNVFFYSVSTAWERTFGVPLVDISTSNLNFGYNTGKGVSLSLNTGLTFKSNSQPNLSISITAYIKPKQRPNASMSFTQSADSQNLISYTDQLGGTGGFDAGIQLYNILPGSSERKMVSSSLRKLTGFGDFSLSGGLNYGGSAATVDGSISMDATTALVFADGIFAISRPLYDSFVILVPDESVGSKKVTLTATSSGTATAIKMPSVLPVSSYQQSIARAEFPDADADVVATIPESVLTTKYRSGIVYKVGLQKQHFVTGRLVNQVGKPYAYIVGDVFNPGGIQVESIFTYEDGTFQIYATEPGEYRIEWPRGIGISYIDIPKEAADTIELGDITASGSKE